MKRNTTKHLFLICGLVLIFGRARGQSAPSTDNPTKIDYNIPSPNAAAFNKYGSVPVNMFTGLPNISVPIYTINAGTHTLPISISYHAGGIRVNDISSDAGLSWRLSAGYSITRTIRGKKDEMGFVGNNDAYNIVKTNVGLSNNFTADSFKNVADGLWDTEPDEFNFNIDGASGKFVMYPNKVVVIPDQDIKVTYSYATGAHFIFTLTDAQGVQYFFNDFATTTSDGCGDNAGTLPYASSWSISKVIYPDTQDSLVFHYTNESQTITSKSESKFYDYGGTTPSPVRVSNCTSYATILEKKLSQIDFPDGRLIFNYNQPKLEQPGSYALSYVAVMDKQNNMSRKINLAYSYYNSSSSDNLRKKLRLDSVFTEASGLIADKYKFAYDDGAIPPLLSTGQDHWGYYNGATGNTSMIPANTYSLYDANSLTFYVPGGNREVVQNYAKMGILTRMTYPTGGYTSFEYESNAAGIDCNNTYINEPVYNTIVAQSTSQCKRINNPPPITQSSTATFIAPSNQSTQVIVSGNAYNCTGTTRSYTFKDLTTNQILAQGASSTPNINLIAGHQYQISTNADCTNAEQNMLDCTEQITVQVTYVQQTGTLKNKPAGGLRISRVTDFDPYSGVANYRTYDYSMPGEPDRSSGVLMFKPRYDYTYAYRVDMAPPSPPGQIHIPQIVQYTSYCFSSNAGNTAQNNDYSVGYQYVREKIGNTGEGGSTLNHYSTPYRSCEIGFPFAPATSRSYQNGQLLDAQIFDATANLKKRTTNYYSFIPHDKVTGWKTAYIIVKSPAETETNQLKINKFSGVTYDYLSDKIRLDSTVNEDVRENGTVASRQLQLYSSTGSYYPYQTVTKNSDGKTMTATTWRSGDFNVVPATGLNGATAALRYMQDNHITGTTVETYSSVDGLVADGAVTEYGLTTADNKTLLLPARNFKLNVPGPVSNYVPINRQITSDAYYLNKDSRFTREVDYLGYNNKGKVGRMTSKGGRSIDLLWGYGNNLPIAKAVNDSAYKLAFTSFESDGSGNWNFDAGNIVNSDFLTGKSAFNLTAGTIAFTAVPVPITQSGPGSGGTTITAGQYVVSYWLKNGTATVNSTAPGTTGTVTTTGWTYFEHILSNPTTITVSGSGLIDELRCYPVGAQMESYTYDLTKGITSSDNGNGQIVFYEYDPMGRLVLQRDINGNIIKQFAYQYQGAQ